MANDLSGAIRTVWAKGMQNQKREDFVGFNIANTKFSDWKGLESIKFPRQNKITVGAIASYNDAIVPQDVTIASETFTPNLRKYFAVKINIDEDIQTYLDPRSQMLVDAKEGFADEYDTAIFSEYANADYVIDDGDLTTASNGGAGNPIAFSSTNGYEVLVRTRAKMNKENMAKNDRFTVLGTDEGGELLLSDRFSKSTDKAEERLEKGVVTVALGMKIFESNNLQEVAGTRHGLAGQGKPISFGAPIQPKVYVSSVDENTGGFWGVIKGTTKFGVTTFSEGGENLIDVQYKI